MNESPQSPSLDCEYMLRYELYRNGLMIENRESKVRLLGGGRVAGLLLMLVENVLLMIGVHNVEVEDFVPLNRTFRTK